MPLPCTAVSGFNWTQLSSKRGSNFDNGMIKRLDAADVRSRTGMWLHQKTFARHVPCVVSGVDSAWSEQMRAMRSWTLDDFERQWGGHTVTVAFQPSSLFYHSAPHPVHGRLLQLPDRHEVLFRHFVEEIRANRRHLEHVVVQQSPSYDLSEFGLPALPPMFEDLARHTLNSRNLWLAVPPADSELHFDAHDSVLLQISGTKRFTMVDPTGMEAVYPCVMKMEQLTRVAPGQYTKEVLHQERDNLALVNFTHPDLKRHPRFKHARIFTVDLPPGSALLLPGYWYHHVQSFADPGLVNVAVNYWFQGNSFATRLQRTFRQNVFINCSIPSLPGEQHQCQ